MIRHSFTHRTPRTLNSPATTPAAISLDPGYRISLQQSSALRQHGSFRPSHLGRGDACIPVQQRPYHTDTAPNRGPLPWTRGGSTARWNRPIRGGAQIRRRADEIDWLPWNPGCAARRRLRQEADAQQPSPDNHGRPVVVSRRDAGRPRLSDDDDGHGPQLAEAVGPVVAATQRRGEYPVSWTGSPSASACTSPPPDASRM